MTDFPDGSTLRESMSGKWYRVEAGSGRSTMLLDLPNRVLLAINVSSNMIEILIPDENDIYRRAGDISFTYEDNKALVHLFSESLEEVNLDNEGASIENTFSEITSVFANLNLSKKEQWMKKRLPDYDK